MTPSKLKEIGFIEGDWIQLPHRAFSSLEDDTITATPRLLNSAATLRFLGLSKSATHETWTRYSKFLETGGEDDIISVALATIRGGQNADSTDDDDWYAAMKSMGASKVLRGRIMTPGFNSIRLSKSPLVWVLQTVKER